MRAARLAASRLSAVSRPAARMPSSVEAMPGKAAASDSMPCPGVSRSSARHNPRVVGVAGVVGVGAAVGASRASPVGIVGAICATIETVLASDGTSEAGGIDHAR